MYKFFALSLLILATGCSLNSDGLKPPSAASTSAKGALFQQTMQMIEGDQNHFASDGCSNPRVESVKPVGRSNHGVNTYDKQKNLISGSISEVWTVNRCGKRIRYYVTYRPDGKGGTNIEITTG